MAYKVLIPQDITDAGKDYLIEKGYEIIIGSGYSVETICKEVADCDALLVRTAAYTREIMEAGKKLKVIARFGAGTDNIDIEAATELGIQVTNAPIANCNSVAEHTMALILGCTCHMVYMDKQSRNGNWDKRNVVKCTEVAGKVLGLVGLGRIGKSVAKKASEGMEMKVIGYDAYIQKDNVPSGIDLVGSVQEVFEKADFVSLHVPATAQTKRSINKNLFKLMKKDAYLINCARGEVVNEEDLYTALTEGWFKGAGLDVLSLEPPELDNPLLTLENIIISPHNAALTVESMDRMGLHAAMGIDEVLTGKKPSWPVNHVI